MKVQTMEEAESGSVTRLANADLLGAYAPEVGAGTTVTILEKDGQLIRRIQGFPDRALIYLNGNRYRPEGLRDGFAISFRMNQGHFGRERPPFRPSLDAIYAPRYPEDYLTPTGKRGESFLRNPEYRE